MKKALLILLFSTIALTAMSQNWKKGLAVVGYHTLTIAAGSIADAQFDMGNKEWSHALHAVEVGMLISGGFIFKPKGGSEILSYLASYTFLRLSLYDSFYNWPRGLPNP